MEKGKTSGACPSGRSKGSKRSQNKRKYLVDGGGGGGGKNPVFHSDLMSGIKIGKRKRGGGGMKPFMNPTRAKKQLNKQVNLQEKVPLKP